MPAKGPLQSVQVFGRKVRPGRRGPPFLLVVGLGRTPRPYELGLPRPQLWGSGASSSPGPCAGLVRGRASRGEARSAAHVSRSVGAGPRLVPGAAREQGQGFALTRSGPRFSWVGALPSLSGVAAAVVPTPQGPGSSLLVCDSRVMRRRWEDNSLHC